MRRTLAAPDEVGAVEMPTTEVDGTLLAYEIIGEAGVRSRPAWVITPGGRFSKDSPGVRELAEAIAAHEQRVLIWDRPNCGASNVRFTGPSELAMQADAVGRSVAVARPRSGGDHGRLGWCPCVVAHRGAPSRRDVEVGDGVDLGRRVRAVAAIRNGTSSTHTTEHWAY